MPSAARAMPKSVTLTRRSGVTRRLAGLTSRCTIPAAWAAPSASAAWAEQVRATSGSSGAPGREQRGERLAVDELHDQVGAVHADPSVGAASP